MVPPNHCIPTGPNLLASQTNPEPLQPSSSLPIHFELALSLSSEDSHGQGAAMAATSSTRAAGWLGEQQRRRTRGGRPNSRQEALPRHAQPTNEPIALCRHCSPPPAVAVLPSTGGGQDLLPSSGGSAHPDLHHAAPPTRIPPPSGGWKWYPRNCTAPPLLLGTVLSSKCASNLAGPKQIHVRVLSASNQSLYAIDFYAIFKFGYTFQLLFPY
jgi:hypothetical protein